jgi:hypothetical protein
MLENGDRHFVATKSVLPKAVSIDLVTASFDVGHEAIGETA